jgi:type VI secretion system secreted protein VgrG
MANIELTFPGRTEAFSVRSFRVEDAISTPFEIAVSAVSELDDVDLDTLAGSDAVFSLAWPHAHDGRLSWTGVCAHAELTRVEPSGLSTYALTIVPDLWLLSQRTNCRVFRRKTAVEIACTVMREWGIEPALRLVADDQPVLDFVIQYNETDLAFVSRTLEEAGVAYFFHAAPGRREIVLTSSPGLGELSGEPIPFHDDVSTAYGAPYVTGLHRSTRVRPRAYTIRDYDPERPSFDLTGVGRGREATDDRLSRYEYMPGKAVVVPRTPRGSGSESAADQGVLTAVAERRLAAARGDHQELRFETNVHDLAPGVIMAVAGHPRSDVTRDARLLVVKTRIEGTAVGEHRMTVRAVFASAPFRPALSTPRPWIGGVQSATVVGLPGQEIHVDEMGRVRVLFPWDLEGARGDGTSCWVRVSQGWAGSGFGMIANPRVGDEVLVAFLDGDPDQPVIVGRLYNATHQPPFALPASKTKTGIRTQTSKGGDGYNELSFEDRAGHERVFLHAQKDHEEVVRHNQTTRVGQNRTEHVTGNRFSLVNGNELASVGGNLVQSVTGDESRTVEGSRSWSVEGNAVDVVRGRAEVRIEEDLTTRVSGRERREVEEESDLILRDDLTFRIHGSATTLVGKHDQKRSYVLHVEGTTEMTGTGATEIRSDKGLVLRCGKSLIHLTPDRIDLVAPTLAFAAEGATAALGGDQVKLKAKGKIVGLSDDKILWKSSGASVSLTAEAKIDGSQIKLKSPDSESISEQESEAQVTTIELVDDQGHPMAHQRYVILFGDGQERSGLLDADGKAEVELDASAEILFPGLVSVEPQ